MATISAQSSIWKFTESLSPLNGDVAFLYENDLATVKEAAKSFDDAKVFHCDYVLKDAGYDSIVIPYVSGSLDSVLPRVYAALKPGGNIHIGFSSSIPDDVSFNLLIAGFIDPKTTGAITTARKTAWDQNSAASIHTSESNVVNSAWTALASTQDLMDGDMVDDDALLAAAVPVSEAAVKQKESDCSTKPRACKNCSCGRAEMEAAVLSGAPLPVISDEELKSSVSSCGNCAKGDAFRCAGCPYLGKPAFAADEVPLSKTSSKVGAAITLDMTDDF